MSDPKSDARAELVRATAERYRRAQARDGWPSERGWPSEEEREEFDRSTREALG